ncbi:MAG: endonuclease/exonuclease/phosphatase family metal-dependent hydrolase [Paracoccaceae bacterium]|jgi:endonuclease/exonuclease/phosphatase family metal-dependent hydrolase
MQQLLIAVALGLFSFGPLQEATAKEPKGLRVITYNVHAWGPIASTEGGKARIGRVRRHHQVLARLALELQLYDVDVIALQEAHSEERVRELASLLDMEFAYFPGGWKGAGWEEGISGAILSRVPILERSNRPGIDPEIPEDELFSRCLGRVLLQHGDEQVAVFCAHMLPSWENTTHIREAEIGALAEAVSSDRAKGRSALVLGDMNHEPGAPEYRLWATHALIDTCERAGTASLTCPSTDPTERIDYVFVAGPMASRLVSARTLNEGAFRTSKDDPNSFALSDHLPVLSVFK